MTKNCIWENKACVMDLDQSKKTQLPWFDLLPYYCENNEVSDKMKNICMNRHRLSLPIILKLNPPIKGSSVNQTLYCSWEFTNLGKNTILVDFAINDSSSKLMYYLEINYKGNEKEIISKSTNKTYGDVEQMRFIFFSTKQGIDENTFTLKISDDNGLFAEEPPILFICMMSALFICILATGIWLYKKRKIFQKNNNEEKMNNDISKLINILVEVPYKNVNDEDKKNKDICTICFENFTAEKGVSILSCKHIFHYKCIRKLCETNLMETKCPNCNDEIFTKIHDRPETNNVLLTRQVLADSTSILPTNIQIIQISSQVQAHPTNIIINNVLTGNRRLRIHSNRSAIQNQIRSRIRIQQS